MDPSDRAVATTAFARVRRHQSPALALAGKFAGRDAVEVEAEGCWVRLSDGRRVLDFASYAVTLLGHRHPGVVEAVRRQLDRMTVSTRSLVNPVTAEAAANLVEYLGGGLPRVYFGLNGTDAVEAAVKLARLATGRPRVLALEGAYHGKSMGSLALTHNPYFRTGLDGLLPGGTHVAAGDADAVDRELAAGDVAAVIFEPVQGEGGVVPVDPAFLRHLVDAAHRHGAFAIADEIQTGLRRCGERSVALADGLPVDAVLVGKPLGGGVLPVSAAVCGEKLYATLTADPFRHTATFGGQPLGCAAALAATRAVEQLAERGAQVGAAVRAGLHALRREHPQAIIDVRGRGLLWGVELASAHLAGEVVINLAEEGLLVSPCLARPASLRLLPPLVASDADVSTAMGALGRAVQRASAVVDESSLATASSVAARAPEAEELPA